MHLFLLINFLFGVTIIAFLFMIILGFYHSRNIYFIIYHKIDDLFLFVLLIKELKVIANAKFLLLVNRRQQLPFFKNIVFFS
jgi:hypothetical protein